MRFDWDDAKAARNLAKHGVAFDEAASVFADTLSWTYPDPDHSEEEQRWLIIRLSEQHRVLVVSHVERGGNIRIISARRATRTERRYYADSL